MTSTAPTSGRRAAPPASTRRWLLRLVVDVLAEPVRKGRLRGGGWHPGLRATVAFTLLLYVAELVLLAAAPWVRGHDELVFVGSLSMPRSIVFFFIAVIVWCLTLLQAASLHAPAWIRWGSLVLVCLTIATFSIAAGTDAKAWVLVVVGSLGLLALTAARWRRSPAWWEVPVCLLLVGVPSLVGVALDNLRLEALGTDGMPLLLSLQMQRLGALAMPAALVAGAAVAELAVSSADSVARAGARFPRVLVPIVLIVGGWRLVEVAATAGELGTSTEPVWVEWIGAAGLIALAAAWGWWLVRASISAATPAPPLEETAAEVGVVGIPVAVALLAPLLPATLLISAVAVLASFGLEGSLLSSISGALTTTAAITWFRVLVGVSLLLVGLRLARRGQVSRSLVLGEIGLVLVVIHLAQLSDGRVRWPYTTDAVVDVAAAAALAAFGFLLVRRRLTSTRAAVLATIVTVPWAFRFADVIDSPFTTLLGLSGVGVTLFGLVWAFTTGAADANGDSPRYPRQTRVLLFLAQSVFGLLALVYAGVARVGSDGSASSPADTTELGAQVVGVPLLLAVLVVMVWRMVSRTPRPEAGRVRRPAAAVSASS